MATLTAPMTIEQFDQAGLPENYELHGGEPVEMSVARPIHSEIKWLICRVFEQRFSNGLARTEMAFRVAVTKDKRAADVGVTSLGRWQAALGESALDGPPEIVVEVLSPSNSASELKAYQALCLAHGTEVFLTVDPEPRTVSMRRKGSRSEETWGESEEFVLELWGNAQTIPVRDFFPKFPANA